MKNTVHRRPPINLVTEDENLFVRAYSWNAVPNEITFSEGFWNITSKRNSVVIQKSNFFQRLFFKPNKTPSLVISLKWMEGYFHWMTEILPILIKAKESDINFKYLFIPRHIIKKGFVKNSLSLFPELKPNPLSNSRSKNMAGMYTVNHYMHSGNYVPHEMKGLRNFLLKSYNIEILEPRKRLYISRMNANRRRITNEEELIPVLEKFGFKTVIAEEMNLKEQAELFSDAEYILGIHGAGLTNMLFMSPKTNVLEIRIKGDNKRNCFFSLASALDLNYFYLFCDSISPQTHDSYLEPKHLQSTLIDILGNEN